MNMTTDTMTRSSLLERAIATLDVFPLSQATVIKNVMSMTASMDTAVDDLAQLKSAITLQTQWQTSTDDWDTEHKLEKNYETRNPNVKRWLKRVKPYRYDKAEAEK